MRRHCARAAFLILGLCALLCTQAVTAQAQTATTRDPDETTSAAHPSADRHHCGPGGHPCPERHHGHDQRHEHEHEHEHRPHMPDHPPCHPDHGPCPRPHHGHDQRHEHEHEHEHRPHMPDHPPCHPDHGPCPHRHPHNPDHPRPHKPDHKPPNHHRKDAGKREHHHKHKGAASQLAAATKSVLEGKGQVEAHGAALLALAAGSVGLLFGGLATWFMYSRRLRAAIARGQAQFVAVSTVDDDAPSSLYAPLADEGSSKGKNGGKQPQTPMPPPPLHANVGHE